MKEVEPTVSPWNLKYDFLSSVKSLKKPLLNVAGSLLYAVILCWSSEIDIWSGVRPSFSLTWKGSRYNQQSITMRDMLIFSLIMYMKKNNALLIGWKRVRSQVIRVQSYNRSLFRLYWLPVMYFSCSLLTKNNIISLAICVINTCKLSKDYKFHLPTGSWYFVVSGKFTRAYWHQVLSKSFSYLYLLHGCVGGERREWIFFLREGAAGWSKGSFCQVIR